MTLDFASDFLAGVEEVDETDGVRRGGDDREAVVVVVVGVVVDELRPLKEGWNKEPPYVPFNPGKRWKQNS